MADGDNQGAGADGPPLRSSGSPLRPRDRNQLGLYFIVLGLLIFYLLIATWPAVDPNFTSRLNQPRIFGFQLKATADQRLFITVGIAGALGSLLHAMTSFGDYVGNRELAQSWVWYLILRTPVGIALALIFCIVMRAGFIAANIPEDYALTHPLTAVNPFGFAAGGALAGMFARQATDKLREIFDSLFKVSQPVNRQDPLNQTKLAIAGTDPAKLIVGGSPALAIIGTHFHKDCTVQINGAGRSATWGGDTRLTVTLLADDLKKETTLQVLVRNPPASGGDSAVFPVTVGPAAPP
jgi:hypothetical protein